MQTLTFQDISLTPVKQDTQIWLTSVDLAKALGYSRSDEVNNLYNRKKDEFTANMTQTTEIQTKGGLQRVRIFSLRGCHLIAMFARTKVAKQFRQWVLDILDKEVGQPVQVDLPKFPNHQLYDLISTSIDKHMDYARQLHHLNAIAPNPILENQFKWVREHIHAMISYCYQHNLTTPTGKPIFKDGELNFMSGNSVVYNLPSLRLMGLVHL